jgi:hypothetical protein
MRHSNQGRFRHQVQFLRRQFLQDGDLPFTDVLSEDLVAQTLTAVGVFWKDRIYTLAPDSNAVQKIHSLLEFIAALNVLNVSASQKPSRS